MEIPTTLFNVKSLQSRLIAQRVKQAKRQHDKNILDSYTKKKPMLPPSDDQKKEMVDDTQARIEKDLKLFNQIMPSRRTWVHLDEKKRYGQNGLRLTSVDQNRKSLELTLSKDKKNNTPYLQFQVATLEDIRKQILECTYELSAPKVAKTIKSEHELRPVCIFPVFDNIVLQECNKILSTWFDPYFCDSSYAFRVKGKRKKAPTHHDTIREILRYLNAHEGKQIYVAECDLKKFYDTINHSVIIEDFDTFLGLLTKPEEEKKVLRHLFLSYLSCYDYQHSVQPKNDDPVYLEGTGDRKFKWVEEEILNKEYGSALSYSKRH